MYKKEHWLMAVVTFLFTFLFYFMTMAPTVTFWDAGEFIAASYTLGVPHPPGTPLFVIIGRVLSALPLPLSIAARLNFLSVLCGSAASFFLYLIAVKITQTWVKRSDTLASRMVIHGGAFAAAVIPPFLRTVWSNSTEFEVYAVTTATIVLCAWLMIYMGSSTDIRRIKRTLLLVIYIVSLSIANHLIVMLVTPGVIIYTLMHDRQNWRYWCSVLGLFFGIYLLVMKGIDLRAVFARLSQASVGDTGIVLSLFNHLTALTGVIFGIFSCVASSQSFYFGALITAICVYWAYRQRSLGFFSAALGLFLLGFSIHAYLLIRAGLSPPINEGKPDNLLDFWAVIGREQYGSNYGCLRARQVWTLVTGKYEVASVTELLENIKFFFKYNFLFYTKYFGWQFGSNMLSAAFFGLGIIGALKHYLSEKKSFYFWLAVFLITGPVLNAYMNFRFGHTQFPEVKIHPSLPAGEQLHEVRERDYFFIVSFAFYGMWAGLGLGAIANRLREAFKLGPESGHVRRSVFAALSALIFLIAFVPLYSNYSKADRSGNYIPSNYAHNLMNSLAPNAIVFTNGDNDTFPLWYIQEVEHVRQDCRVVNLSLLNTTWYIKQMRDVEPKVPIRLSDEQIDSLMPITFARDMRFKLGEMDITYPKNTPFYVKDRLVLHILVANNWKKPVYFTTSTPKHNRVGLNAYFTVEGITYRLNPRKASDIAESDSNFVLIPQTEEVINVEKTRRLLLEVYNYDTFFREGESGEAVNKTMLRYFLKAFQLLSNALVQQKQYDDLMETYRLGRMFLSNRHEWNPHLAELYAIKGQYGQALEMIDSSNSYYYESPNMQLYQILAQKAVNSNHGDEAARILNRAIEVKPDFLEAYANLFMLYNAMGNKQKAVEMINRYLERFPDKNVVREELERYLETDEFDLQKAFGQQG